MQTQTMDDPGTQQTDATAEEALSPEALRLILGYAAEDRRQADLEAGHRRRGDDTAHRNALTVD
jgi:outer membrane receptor for ferrienterochelin and colicin